MRFPNRALLILCCLLGAESARAVTANLKENYQPIIDRNPFGLKPPPPPPTNNVTTPPVEKPKVEIFLTGIVSVGHPVYKKQAFLLTREQNKKEPNYYALTEEMEKDGIKVLAIDEVNKKVRINTDAGETLLSFQTHGVAPPAAPALPAPGQPGAMPGQPGAVPQPLPGGNPNPQPGFQPVPAPSSFPANNPSQPSVTPSANPSFRSIPSRSVRSRGGNYSGGNINEGAVSQPGGGVPQQEQAPVIDPAEQYLRMHLDRTQKERQGIPMPPLPPIE